MCRDEALMINALFTHNSRFTIINVGRLFFFLLDNSRSIQLTFQNNFLRPSWSLIANHFASRFCSFPIFKITSQLLSLSQSSFPSRFFFFFHSAISPSPSPNPPRTLQSMFRCSHQSKPFKYWLLLKNSIPSCVLFNALSVKRSVCKASSLLSRLTPPNEGPITKNEGSLEHDVCDQMARWRLSSQGLWKYHKNKGASTW